MTAHDPVQKEMATEKKEERIQQAEREKHEAREHNAAGHMDQAHYTTTGPGSGTATYSTTGPGSGPATYSTIGDGQPMGATQMSSIPEREHGYGLGLRQVHGLGRGERHEEVMGSNPTGTNIGMSRTTVHNAQMGGTAPGSGPDFS